jgi:hypothetical protein
MLDVEGRGARDVAKRAHETTGQIFRYAIAHGIASRNPAADFNPKDILAEFKEEKFSRGDAKMGARRFSPVIVLRKPCSLFKSGNTCPENVITLVIPAFCASGPFLRREASNPS